jgi:hypothetical protein
MREQPGYMPGFLLSVRFIGASTHTQRGKLARNRILSWPEKAARID